MKNYKGYALYILLTFVFITNVRGQNVNYGEYNIYIGKNVAKNSIKGSYNIVIVDSADHVLQNINESYLFIVDYDCKYIKERPVLEGYLRALEKYGFVCGGFEAMKANRKEIWLDVRHWVLNER